MITWLSFLFFTGLVAVIAWWRTRHDDQHTTAGYFLAGRSLPWYVVGGSLLLTNLSTEQLVGLNGGAYRSGMIVMAWEVWSALAIVAMAVLFLPKYLKSGITTVPEFLELRYGPLTRTLTSLIFLGSIVLNVLPFVLLSGGTFMARVFDVPELSGIDEPFWNLAIVCSVLAFVGGAYAVCGGLKAVAVSDAVNGVGLVVGGFLIPILGLRLIGQGNFREGLGQLVAAHPERLSSLGDRTSDLPWETLLTGLTLVSIYYWCTNQGIVQRTFAAQNLQAGQKGVLFAALLKLLGPVYLVLPGIIAWHLASTGAVGVPESPDDAYGFLVNLVLPDWARGFFAAAIFGAILSSFNSFLNSSSTLLSIDLYQRAIRPNSTQQEIVLVGRISSLIMIPLSVGLALFFSRENSAGMFHLMKSLAAVLNIPLLAIVVMAFISRRTPQVAAILALVVGMTVQAVWGIWLNDGRNQIGIYAGAWRASEFIPWVNLHWLHLAGINFSILMILMFVVQQITPREPAYVQTWTREVDITPWKLAWPAGIAVMVLIALLYAGLAWQFGIASGTL